MSWKLDSDRPIHTQLQEILQTQIASGALPPGSKMKSVRELATEAGVNPNTMQRAFAELERLNLIRTERTAGRFVTEDAARIAVAKDEIAMAQLELFRKKMKQLGFEKKEIVDFVRSKWEEEEDG
ncbi:MAG: GntR family transcriptional regulator [Lachnospiraceae bacterium]|nr:GntR family transcriptional regulator [Lachnospiraceae bacterium]